MTWLRDTLNNKGARAKCLKWACFALATSLHVLAKVTKCSFDHLNSEVLETAKKGRGRLRHEDMK